MTLLDNKYARMAGHVLKIDKCIFRFAYEINTSSKSHDVQKLETNFNDLSM